MIKAKELRRLSTDSDHEARTIGLQQAADRIEKLVDCLDELIPFDYDVKDIKCWCSRASSECMTPGCIKAREAMGLKP